MTERWLLADLGGTTTRVGLAGPEGIQAGSLRRFHNADFDGLSDVLRSYLEQVQPGAIQALCAGVAGPVRDGAAQLTNHDWFIDSAELRAATGAQSVTLLNDLQVQGYALDDLAQDQLRRLFTGAESQDTATRLVMGLGTGCNIAVVHTTPTGLLVPPAEAGHASLPYATGRIGALVDHLGQVQAHRPVESALSGPGLSNIYEWVSGLHAAPENILSAHRAGEPHATEALELFSQLLGQVAGDLALAHLPMGGLYFIGGMARAIAPLLDQMGFYEPFTAKGPYTQIMRDIPVFLIEDDSAALQGCARYLRQLRA